MEKSNQIKDITGQRFGSLVAIEFDHIGANKAAYWKYKCDCGKEVVLRSNTVTYRAKHYAEQGKKEFPSCGCKELEHKTKHGFRKAKDTHPAYKAWRSMLSRCYNPKDPSYKWYGALGVKVCDKWLHDPKAFCDWAVNNGWFPGAHIDKDILCEQKGIQPHIYSPDTCQWVTARTNVGFATNRDNFGKHSNVKLSHEDVEKILELYKKEHVSGPKLAKMFHVSNSSIYRILHLQH